MNKVTFKKIGKKLYFSNSTQSNNLLIMSEFLPDLGGGKDPSVIKWLKEEKGMGFNCSSFDKVNDNIHINLDYVPGLDDLVIPLPDLLPIVEKWMELTEAGVEEIVLTEEDDGSFTIKEG